MKQSIGGAFTLQLVIIFILLFVSFITLSINFTRAYAIKNELISFIEKNEGVTSQPGGTIDLINNYLKYNKYTVMSGCQEGYHGVNDLNSTNLEEANKGSKYYYCVKKVDDSSSTHPYRAKYDIEVFFQFNIPVFGNYFVFRAHGTTGDVIKPADNIEIDGG